MQNHTCLGIGIHAMMSKNPVMNCLPLGSNSKCPVSSLWEIPETENSVVGFAYKIESW